MDKAVSVHLIKFICTSLTLFIFLTRSLPACAHEVSISIKETRHYYSLQKKQPYDKPKVTTLNFTFDPALSTLRPVSAVSGAPVPMISKYHMNSVGYDSDRKLYLGDKALAPSDEILYQCEIDDVDLVIVYIEHNSFSSPLKIFSAIISHPDQVREFFAYVIKDGKLKSSTEIYRDDPLQHEHWDYVADGSRTVVVLAEKPEIPLGSVH